MVYYKKFSIFLTFIMFYSSSICLSLSETFKDNGVSTFMYHRFGEDKYPSTNVSIEQFASHIEHVVNSNYNIISLEEVIKIIDENNELEKNTIAFSIDDAYESFYINAWPLFKKYQIPVTLFISTDEIDNKVNGYMTWDQIRSFIIDGGNIGQHTSSHLHLPLNDGEIVKKDILKSHKSFMKELGFIPKLFAYPYGESSKDTINILKELNISHAFGQHSGVLSKYNNRYYLPRFSLNEQFGNLERFIFAAESLPMIIKDFIPSEMYLSENLKPNIEFTVLNNIETDLINCFSNAGGSWGKQKITNITQKRIQISLSENFLSGRGRINCTAQKNNNWYWFGYQFLVK